MTKTSEQIIAEELFKLIKESGMYREDEWQQYTFSFYHKDGVFRQLCLTEGTPILQAELEQCQKYYSK